MRLLPRGVDHRDQDLLSVQEARDLVEKAAQAQEILVGFTQAQVDRIVQAMAHAGSENARRLAELAVEETGFGVFADKVAKNKFATEKVYEHIKELRTVGIINHDHDRGVVEIAEPMGVVAGLIPTTNPTSTVMYKALISLKARNTIVFSPHPRAVRCTCEAAKIMEAAAVSAGAPPGVVNCMTLCTKEGTNELMHHAKVGVILATGGSAMVKAAYSAGKPAYGVGPGNVPAFIERTADLEQSVAKIIKSKTFDHGTICASEQAVVTEAIIADQVKEAFLRQGGYLLSAAEAEAVAKTVILPGGGVNPKVVGQGAKVVAEMAGVTVPEKTRVLLACLNGVGKEYPLSAEKLCPVLAFYVVEDWRQACERCFELLNYGGLGHTLVIHSKNEEIIKEFALKKPVFRILVNTPSSQGAIGLTTGLPPALTLGPGTWGGSITADNVGPRHLINRKRLAYDLTAAHREQSGLINHRYTGAEIAQAVRAYLQTG